MFKENTKRFYRELGKKTIEISKPPGKEALEMFGANIWEKEKRHNERAEWIKEIENENQQTPTCEVRQKKKELLDDGKNARHHPKADVDRLQAP